ncbi:DUF732 domain-containing protein [Mycobacterium malmoense]|uniref:DUF732 domain-containing protein n=1 Tax=Mycobacterium malmoense TaxID=1780 RepID=UPI0008F8AB8C|nr:DUF732 domain-containing protein [Mycobacterium malmoense]OIN78613.1 hypothetical protein BMG05_21155 [Mycobacterium malmoense]
MTAPTTYRPSTERTVHRVPGILPLAARANLINAGLAVLRPLAVMGGVLVAGTALVAPVHADPPTGSITTVLNHAGFGNDSSLSNALAGVGQSICPMLVKPGATLASIASQLSGNTGLSPGIAGFVASMAIQMQCPGFMTSLANGQMPFPLQGLAANPGLPSPFRAPGASPVPAMPFSPPGAGPAATNPLKLPGM